MRRVIWTPQAVADLRNARSYIEDFNPLAAQKLATRLWTAAESLGEQPERGRSIGRGRREFTNVRPYLIRYRLKGGAVEILAIRHGARKPV